MARAARETIYLEHYMPGRARLRVPKPRTAAQVGRMAGRVSRGKRVRDVDVNRTTGSLLVSFDPDDPIDLIVEEIRALGFEVLSALRPPPGRVRTESTGAAVVKRVAGRANQQLHLVSRGHVDLRLAVPAIYTALALRNFIRHRARLRDASWYQLLYWAFDSFFKLHEERTVSETAGSRGRLVD